MNMEKYRQLYERTSHTTIIVYVVLRVLVVLVLVRQIMTGNFTNALLCVLSLALFSLPFLLEERLALELPSGLQISIFCFIFAAEILGEINNFYGHLPFWDTMLHTINGFLCASIGFNLVDLLNKKVEGFQMTPLFIAILAFCFSMTVGVCWEFIEYAGDVIAAPDMQKDWYISSISSIKLNEAGENVPVRIDGIDHTVLYNKDGEELYTIKEGYLDIGLIDTMKDLFVNLVGALVFSTMGYLYMTNRDRYRFAGRFHIVRRKEEDG